MSASTSLKIGFHNKKKQKPGMPDYYWRDYNGEIPHDAILGGYTVNKKPTYIGQAFLADVGIIPGTIYPGQVGIRLPFGWKATFSDIAVKILCSKHLNCFSWEPAENKTLHSTTIGRHLVVGGYENGQKLNVGRVTYQNQMIVGKVLGYKAGNAGCYFVFGDKEIGVGSYQVLIYY
jgi:hypothetical protein